MGSEAGGETLLLTLHASFNFPGKEQSVPFRFGPLGGFPTLAKRKGKLTDYGANYRGNYRVMSVVEVSDSPRTVVLKVRQSHPTAPGPLSLTSFCFNSAVSTKQG